MFTQLIFEHSLRTRINAEERGQDFATQSESSLQTDSNSTLPPAEPASENESSAEKDNMVGKVWSWTAPYWATSSLLRRQWTWLPRIFKM